MVSAVLPTPPWPRTVILKRDIWTTENPSGCQGPNTNTHSALSVFRSIFFFCFFFFCLIAVHSVKFVLILKLRSQSPELRLCQRDRPGGGPRGDSPGTAGSL